MGVEVGMGVLGTIKLREDMKSNRSKINVSRRFYE